MKRSTGAIAYWFDGERFDLTPIKPDSRLFWDEIENPDLPLENMAYVAQVLKEVSE